MLVAPLHIRGKIGRWESPHRKELRRRWIEDKRMAGHTRGEIAAALGIRIRAVSNITPGDWSPGRSCSAIRARGIRFGKIGAAVQSLPWPALDALEAHCARTGLTMAEALADAWVERMEASQ